MARGDQFQHIRVQLGGGLNQDVDSAVANQCAEALNVWAPDGRRLEQRPGYVGLWTLLTSSGGAVATTGAITLVREAPLGTFTTADPLDVSALAIGQRWFFGFASPVTTPMAGLAALGGVSVTSSVNANATRARMEYWSGATWTALPFVEWVNAVGEAPRHLRGSPDYFGFVPPQDWSTTTVDGTTAYFVRFTIWNADVDAACAVSTGIVRYNPYQMYGLFAAQLPSQKKYIVLMGGILSYTTVLFWTCSSSPRWQENAANTIYQPTDETFHLDEPPAFTVVTATNEVFAAYHNRVYLFAGAAPAPATEATVETRDFAVGPVAPFDTTLIAQDSGFPTAKYITFFKNRLWAARTLDAPWQIQWSGPLPYHKVWPSQQREFLVEDDNSPITGMAGLAEQLVVFKQDSTWIMVDSGQDALSLQLYSPVRVVAGVGCVSNSSIRQIRGRLIFLAEDGVYAFDGTPGIKRVTDDPESGVDRLRDVWHRVTPGRRAFAAAAHWRTRSCYLLALSLDGSDANNHVICWDYKNNSWWLWDNIEAQHWLVDEGTANNEVLYFGDSAGHLFEFGVGRTDHGGTITAYAKTQRMGYLDNATKVLREVAVTGENRASSLNIGVFIDDSSVANNMQTLDFTDPAEVAWGLAWGFTWNDIRRRPRKAHFRNEGQWAQVEVRNTTKNTALAVSQLDVSFLPLGRR